MLFRGDDVHKQMSLLSGGERARVALAELLLDKPNVILLDEPTNHLDIPSREALENALKNYDGTILCVSHDRFFLEQIVERLLVLAPPNIVSFSGTYHDWVAKQKQPKSNPAPKKSEPKKVEPVRTAKPQATHQTKKQNPYARPFGRLSEKELEKEIADTEIAISEHQSKFGDAGAMKDQKHARKLQDDYQSLSKKLEALEAEYFEREK
jgi:ATP-binding cassette subfamily F protein 3